MINSQSIDPEEEEPGENTQEFLESIDDSILKLKESIQTKDMTKRALHEKESKTPEDMAKLLQLEEELDREIKALVEQIRHADQLVLKMQDETRDIIPNDSCSAGLKQMFQGLANSFNYNYRNGDSMGEFHKVIVLNHNSERKMLPHIMVMQSMNKIDEYQTACGCCSSCSESDCSEDYNCCCKSDDVEKCIVPVKSCESVESENIILKSKLRQLEECLQNVVNKNQDLKSKLIHTIEQNEALARVLKEPGPFKISTTGGIRFPGKKAMEEKLLIQKKAIAQMNLDIGVMQINRLKLKSAKELIDHYTNAVIHCKCEDPTYKNKIQTIIKVKIQKLRHIETQLRQKFEEMNQMKLDFDSCVKANNEAISKNQKLSDCLGSLKKQIEEYNNVMSVGLELRDQLKKKMEEIETTEMVIKTQADEMNEYDQKLKIVQAETDEIVDKTNKLEEALKNLSQDFNTEYSNLELVYHEQMEEMMALPTLLKATHIKLQAENDKRVLAEETRDKLERKIREIESSQKPINPKEKAIELEIENQLISTLSVENKKLKSKLNTLEEKIYSATTILDTENKHLEAINRQVQDAQDESAKHENALNNFSTIHMEKLKNDVCRLQDLLMQLQNKECIKAVNKKEVMDSLKSNIESIYRKLAECKSEMHKFLDQSSDRMMK